MTGYPDDLALIPAWREACGDLHFHGVTAEDVAAIMSSKANICCDYQAE